MSLGDVRGLLHYVPQFRGKVFVILVDAVESSLPEVMLDLLALQGVGVKLVIGSTVHSTEILLDRAAEVELKYSQAVYKSDQDELLAALGRGQSVIADFLGEEPFSEQIASLAAGISAAKLVLLHEARDIPAQGDLRAAEVTVQDSGIMVSAAAACHAGVPRIHILDAGSPAVLLDEFFSNEGVGTMVYADSYRVIRPLREEDIVELLGMIGRSVRTSRLVPRGYADIEKNLSDYFVMDIDGNVVGSVALHCYPEDDRAEIACLYVKQAHEGLGYGYELVKYTQAVAKELGVKTVFALTNRAANFFQDELGYRPLSIEEIPSARKAQLTASGRSSQVFAKTL